MLALHEYIPREGMTHATAWHGPVCSCADQHHMRADCMLATDLDQGYEMFRVALTDDVCMEPPTPSTEQPGHTWGGRLARARN